MKIDKDCAVTILCKITDANGRVIQDGRKPIVYLHGGYDNILPPLEAALQAQEAGFRSALALTAVQAFGERDESLVRSIPKREFPPGVKVGGQLEGAREDGSQQVFTVMKIKGEQVLLDGNHALAGQALRFALEVVGVRRASDEEIAHRHVHGEHGHQH